MYQHTDEKIHTSHGIHLPSLADPMALLDQLENRLEHCESVVTQTLEQIQGRLDALEADVRAIRADMGGGHLKVEQDLVRIAERLTKLEDRQY